MFPCFNRSFCLGHLISFSHPVKKYLAWTCKREKWFLSQGFCLLCSRDCSSSYHGIQKTENQDKGPKHVHNNSFPLDSFYLLKFSVPSINWRSRQWHNNLVVGEMWEGPSYLNYNTNSLSPKDFCHLTIPIHLIYLQAPPKPTAQALNLVPCLHPGHLKR